MKNQIPPFVLFSLILCLYSCQPTIDSNHTTAQATFTANPQPVEKQEVKTLEIGADAPDFNLPGVDGKYYSLRNLRYC